ILARICRSFGNDWKEELGSVIGRGVGRISEAAALNLIRLKRGFPAHRVEDYAVFRMGFLIRPIGEAVKHRVGKRRAGNMLSESSRSQKHARERQGVRRRLGARSAGTGRTHLGVPLANQRPSPVGVPIFFRPMKIFPEAGLSTLIPDRSLTRS